MTARLQNEELPEERAAGGGQAKAGRNGQSPPWPLGKRWFNQRLVFSPFPHAGEGAKNLSVNNIIVDLDFSEGHDGGCQVVQCDEATIQLFVSHQ